MPTCFPDDLLALIAVTYGAPQIAPGLLAWIDGTWEWELNRRAGLHYELQPPAAAIPPEEDAVSIDAVIALRTSFVDSIRDRRHIHSKLGLDTLL